MASLDPDDLAQAFADEDSGAVAPPQNAYAPAPSFAAGSKYNATLRALARFLVAAAQAAGQPGQFSQILSQTPEPADLTSAMQRIYGLSGKQMSAVFAAMTDEQRQYFTQQCLALSEAVKDDMADLSLAAAMMRWILQAGAPQFPQDAQARFKKNFGALEYAAKVARPDDTNPEFVKLMVQLKQLQEKKPALKDTSSSAAASSGGVSRSAFIVVAVLLAAAVIALVAVLVMYRKKSKGGAVLAAAPLPALSVGASIPPPVPNDVFEHYASSLSMGGLSFPSLTAPTNLI